MMDRTAIAARIPHQGSMCLLDGVERWDDEQIVCFSHSHRLADNPLRAAGRLGIANAIEYAAQAMALHGALLAGDAAPARAGYLASVRELRWHCQQLDTQDAALSIHVQRLSGNAITAMYQFELAAAGAVLASGRLSVVLDAAALAPRLTSS
ncbi:3-hydroxylacyl-ACP dehydratase [Aquitalea sp. FJL05]|uniref:3-hydroxylacyl-ACP dehydratase n=1 Tax=Aquitalea TaxID=407217 RepID=UPI000F5A8BC8|nr:MULTISPECIES: 3-hydroxylacyl-ACP dehydratase [Aquitalea]RQO68830.1 3-hydroxylacyl-ACP dehydratase [Aquitalea sp. FJL05]